MSKLPSPCAHSCVCNNVCVRGMISASMVRTTACVLKEAIVVALWSLTVAASASRALRLRSCLLQASAVGRSGVQRGAVAQRAGQHHRVVRH